MALSQNQSRNCFKKCRSSSLSSITFCHVLPCVLYFVTFYHAFWHVPFKFLHVPPCFLQSVMFLLYVLSRSSQVLSRSSLSFVKLFKKCIRSVTFRATVARKHESRRFGTIWQPSLHQLWNWRLGCSGAVVVAHQAPIWLCSEAASSQAAHRTHLQTACWPSIIAGRSI